MEMIQLNDFQCNQLSGIFFFFRNFIFLSSLQIIYNLHLEFFYFNRSRKIAVGGVGISTSNRYPVK